jgi:hypothetical protein
MPWLILQAFHQVPWVALDCPGLPSTKLRQILAGHGFSEMEMIHKDGGFFHLLVSFSPNPSVGDDIVPKIIMVSGAASPNFSSVGMSIQLDFP